MYPETLATSPRNLEGTQGDLSGGNTHRMLSNMLLVRATLPSALNVINASSVGKLVQLVTASRLILNHEGQVDPMKDECHYQMKH